MRTLAKRGPVGPRPCWLSLEAVREAGVKLRRAFAGGGSGCAVGGKREEVVIGVRLVVYLGVEHAERGELRQRIFPAQGIRRGIGGIGWLRGIRTAQLAYRDKGEVRGMVPEIVGERHHEGVALGHRLPARLAPLRVVEAQADLQTHAQGISPPKAE